MSLYTPRGAHNQPHPRDAGIKTFPSEFCVGDRLTRDGDETSNNRVDPTISVGQQCLCAACGDYAYGDNLRIKAFQIIS